MVDSITNPAQPMPSVNNARHSGNEGGTLPSSHFKVALPMVAVGAFVLALGFAFCCYVARLRRLRSKTSGYKKVVLNIKQKENPLADTKNDSCPVCLDDFKNREVLAICDCSHVFHKKCLTKWLEHKPTCPMCMAIVSSHYRGHHHHHHSLASGRITATSFNIPGSLQPPNSFRGIQINQELWWWYGCELQRT